MPIKLSISRLKMVVASVFASNEPLRLANLRFSFLAIRQIKMGEAGLEPAKPEARGLQPRVIAAIRLPQLIAGTGLEPATSNL